MAQALQPLVRTALDALESHEQWPSHPKPLQRLPPQPP